MISASVIFVICGVVCLAVSGFLMYRMMPRAGQASRLMQTDSGATIVALGQFTLLIAGVAFLAKAIF